MIYFEINKRINDFSVYSNNYSCFENQIGSVFYDINISSINYEKLYSNIPMFDEHIEDLEDGIYTWMLLTCDKFNPSIYLVKVQNKNEIGTKHSNILHRLHFFENKNYIFFHYAGELKKKGNEIHMNFSSGTYMREIFENDEKENSNTFFPENKRIYYEADILDFFNNKKQVFPITFVDNDETFINEEDLPLKKQHLDLYKLCDCEILQFFSQLECQQYIKNKNDWERFYRNIKIFEKHKNKYNFLKPPEKPFFHFKGVKY